MSERKTAKIDKYHLSLSGEYRVASELLKRGLNATVTLGNAKSADVIAYGPNRRAVVIEVKTSQQKNFVTGFYNKYRTPEQEHPDFWVLVQVKAGPKQDFTERFFVLSHFDLSVVQAKRNQIYRVRCGDVKEDEHLSWEDHSRMTNDANGVDNVLLADVEHSGNSENNWGKIIAACSV